MSDKFLKKLSAKTLGFDTENIRELVKKGEKALFTIVGTVTGVKQGNGDNGPWVKFMGGFGGVNMVTGECFRSGELFLPASVTPILEAELLASLKQDGFSGLEIAFEIGAKKTDSVIGYEYTVKDKADARERDPVTQLMNKYVDPKLLAKA